MKKIGKSDHCEAIFRSKDLIFLWELILQNICEYETCSTHLHINHPTKRKKGTKIGKSDHCEAIFRIRDMIFFVGAHNSIYFVNIKLFSPTSTLTTPQKGKNRQI